MKRFFNLAKLAKFLVGLALLPFCAAATQSVVLLVQSIKPPSYSHVPLAAWWLVGGFAFWLFLFFAMPRPVRTYILAHELTHALWGWLMGARVSRLRVWAKGGSVSVSRSNFLISLAPYFFPLYTVLAIAGYYLLSIFFDLRAYEPFWLALVGLTWSFHLTFTVTTLMQHQPDIRQNGRLFSYALIYFMNVLGIGLWIVMVASPTLQGFADVFSRETSAAWTGCMTAARRILAAAVEFSNHWKK